MLCPCFNVCAVQWDIWVKSSVEGIETEAGSCPKVLRPSLMVLDTGYTLASPGKCFTHTHAQVTLPKRLIKWSTMGSGIGIFNFSLGCSYVPPELGMDVIGTTKYEPGYACVYF